MIRYALDVLVMLASVNTRASELRLSWAGWSLELQTKVREYFTITEKAPTRAFSLLKVPTSTITFKTLLGHYAKCNVKVLVFRHFQPGEGPLRL